MAEKKAFTEYGRKSDDKGVKSTSDLATTKNEKYMDECGGVIEFRHLENGAKASCEIPSDGGSGFFIQITLSGKDHFGIMTCNHVIGVKKSFTVKLKSGSTKEVNPKDLGNIFFSCKFLDVTFIELNDVKKKEFETAGVCFLQPTRNIHESKIYILQYPYECLSFAEGFLKSVIGFTIFHKVTTDGGSSGSMILNKEGFVLGIHKAAFIEHNLGVSFEIILQVMEAFYSKKYSLLLRQKLTPEIKNALKTHDYNEQDPGLFKNHQTNQWLYWTQHSWYSTTTRPTQGAEFTKWDWKPDNKLIERLLGAKKSQGSNSI